jgi:hypothetical protein
MKKQGLEPDELSYKRLKSKIKSYRWLLSSFPGCLEVAICNNFSFKNVGAESDIDLFFVLDSRRFFTARLIITILTHLSGVRRHSSKISGRFCLSFFVSDQNLDLTNLRLSEKDYYFYFWLKHIVFTRNNTDLQNKILIENKWFKEPYFTQNTDFEFVKNTFAKVLEKIIFMPIFDRIEFLLMGWQLTRARRKNRKFGNPTGVVISDGVLKFHQKDKRADINRLVDDYLLLSK